MAKRNFDPKALRYAAAIADFLNSVNNNEEYNTNNLYANVTLNWDGEDYGISVELNGDFDTYEVYLKDGFEQSVKDGE